MLKINEQYSFEKDTYGWKLHDFHLGVNRATGKPTGSQVDKVTYYPTIRDCADQVTDRMAGEVHNVDLSGMIKALDRLTDAIETKAEAQ